MQMKRNLRVLSLALAACAIFLSTLPSFETLAQNSRRGARRRAGRPVRQPRVSVDAINARFHQIADAYLRGYYAFNPTTATALGLHEYDSQLESRSPEAISREVRRLRAQLQSLLRMWDGALSEDARLDYQVLVSHAQGQLLELEGVRPWQRDPSLYNRIAAAGIDAILKRNYAPAEERLDAFLAREHEITRLLAEARANLENPPRIYTETAIA